MSLIPADGGKHLIFKIQATSFSSGHNNSLFRKNYLPPLKGFPYLLLHKEASWLVHGKSMYPLGIGIFIL